MEFTKEYAMLDDGQHVSNGGEMVRVTEVVELDEQAQRRIISKAVRGDFASMSMDAVWDEVMCIGDVVEYEETRINQRVDE